MKTHALWRTGRHGFTLIEMLVTISIILMLATLAVAIMPRIDEKQRATRGASELQGWLTIARQLAKRDAPSLRGIRLLSGTQYPNSANPTTNWVHELQLVDQPPDFTGGSVSATWNGTMTTYQASGTGLDFSGGFSAQPANMWAVQGGDFLLFKDGLSTNVNDNLFKINSGGVTATTLTLTATTGAIPHPSTTSYSIIRGPRPRPGEGTLQLPQNVAIDLSTNITYSNWLPSSVTAAAYSPAPYVDIMFTSSGAVTGWAGSADKIQLWVRDISQDPVPGSTATFNGDQLLITIYVRTGLIAAHPVDITLNGSGSQYNQPYSFTQDGRSSGF